MFSYRYPNRDTFLATRAVWSVDITPGTTKTVLNQLVIGFHIHIHMGIGEGTHGFTIVQVATGLRGRGEEINFYLIIHSLKPLGPTLSLERKTKYVTSFSG